METKKYSQFGTFSVIIILPLFLLFTGMMIKSGLTNSPEFYVFIFAVLTFLVGLLTFYKLTITIDNTNVSFKLGVGLFVKSYKITDIKTCRPVTNPFIYGVGIRMLPNGWLYSVSGLKAIELQFYNKKSVVRIGTNKSEEISQLIQSKIGREIHVDNENVNKKRFISRLALTIILIPALILALVLIPNYQETKVQLNNTSIKIRGIYGLTIPYVDIEQIDTISAMPKISLRTNGYAFGETLTGHFKLYDKSRVKLFIKKGFAPYIMIKAKGQVPIYINFKDKRKTIGLYNELINKE